MSVNIIPISDLRRRPGQIVRAIRESGAVYITQHGRPAAVMVDYNEYEAMRAQLEDLADLASLEATAAEPERDYEAFLAEMNSDEA